MSLPISKIGSPNLSPLGMLEGVPQRQMGWVEAALCSPRQFLGRGGSPGAQEPLLVWIKGGSCLFFSSLPHGPASGAASQAFRFQGLPPGIVIHWAWGLLSRVWRSPSHLAQQREVLVLGQGSSEV